MLHTIFALALFACSNEPEIDNTPDPQDVKVQQAEIKEFVETEIRGATEVTSRVEGTIIERHKQIGKEPSDTIALWVEAAILAQEGKAEGFEALGYLTVPFKSDSSWRKRSAYTYFTEAIAEKNPVFRSFVVGATPENGYAIDENNIKISIAYEANRDVRGRKFMVNSSGSNMPRPVYLQKSNKTGLFFVNEFSSMYVDVTAPIDPDKETFH